MVVNDVTHSNEINYIHRSNNEHHLVVNWKPRPFYQQVKGRGF